MCLCLDSCTCEKSNANGGEGKFLETETDFTTKKAGS